MTASIHRTPQDGAGAVADEEGHELGDLLGAGGASEGDPAEGGQDLVPRHSRLDALGGGDAVDEGGGAVGGDRAGGDDVDPDTVGGDLAGQALAVGRQRGLGRGVAQRPVGQGQAALDRGDVDDAPAAGAAHRRDQSAVQAHGGEQVEGKLVVPVLVGERGEAARGGVGAAQGVHEGVGSAEVLVDTGEDQVDPGDRGEIGGHEILVTAAGRGCAGRSQHGGAGLAQEGRDGGPGAAAGTGDQDSSSFEVAGRVRR